MKRIGARLTVSNMFSLYALPLTASFFVYGGSQNVNGDGIRINQELSLIHLPSWHIYIAVAIRGKSTYFEVNPNCRT